jgi:hypothetical protein
MYYFYTGLTFLVCETCPLIVNESQRLHAFAYSMLRRTLESDTDNNLGL